MPKPQGIKVGKFGLFDGIDPSDFLEGKHPSLPGLGQGTIPQAPKVKGTYLLKSPVVKRSLPVINQQTGLRDCTTCPAPCCRILAAEITPDEASSGKWEYVTENGRHFLPRPYGRCVYLSASNSCTIYSDRPRVCLDYRCDRPGKEDHRVSSWFVKNCV